MILEVILTVIVMLIVVTCLPIAISIKITSIAVILLVITAIFIVASIKTKKEEKIYAIKHADDFKKAEEKRQLDIINSTKCLKECILNSGLVVIERFKSGVLTSEQLDEFLENCTEITEKIVTDNYTILKAFILRISVDGNNKYGIAKLVSLRVIDKYVYENLEEVSDDGMIFLVSKNSRYIRKKELNSHIQQ